MRDLKQIIEEGKQTVFDVAFSDFVDEEGLPITCHISVDSKYAKQFDEFGDKEEANTFCHFCGDLETCY